MVESSYTSLPCVPMEITLFRSVIHVSFTARLAPGNDAATFGWTSQDAISDDILLFLFTPERPVCMLYSSCLSHVDGCLTYRSRKLLKLYQSTNQRCEIPAQLTLTVRTYGIEQVMVAGTLLENTLGHDHLPHVIRLKQALDCMGPWDVRWLHATSLTLCRGDAINVRGYCEHSTDVFIRGDEDL